MNPIDLAVLTEQLQLAVVFAATLCTAALVVYARAMRERW